MAASTSLLSIPSSNLKLRAPFRQLQFSRYIPPLFFKSQPHPSLRLCLPLQCSAVQVAESSEVTTEAVSSPEPPPSEEDEGKKRKVYVSNLPWSFAEADIQKLFSECGEVQDIDIIKHKNGKSRGYAFVTMSSAEEALAAVQKLDTSDVMGRTIKAEFSKTFRRPSRSAAENNAILNNTKVYVSNLAYKARSVHLKEFFSGFNPVSTRVVFENANGRSAGYGFVGFATKEEAEAAIAELDGKELIDRPVRLKISVRSDKKRANSWEETQDGTTKSENSSEESQVGMSKPQNSSEEAQDSTTKSENSSEETQDGTTKSENSSE